MGKTLKYVKEFDFGPQKTFVKGYERGGKAYMDGGKACYAEGGKADIAQHKAMIKAAVHKHEKGMHPGKPMTKLAHGGKAMAAKGGKMSPAISAMARKEIMATPTMEKRESVQREAVRAPAGGLGMLRDASRLGIQGNKNPGVRRRMPVAPREPMIPAYKEGGQAKIATVMREFKEGKLHSGGSGKVVKNPKQAIAIALSESRAAKKRA